MQHSETIGIKTAFIPYYNPRTEIDNNESSRIGFDKLSLIINPDLKNASRPRLLIPFPLSCPYSRYSCDFSSFIDKSIPAHSQHKNKCFLGIC